MATSVNVHIDDLLVDAYFMDPFGDLAKDIERRAGHVQTSIQHNAPRHTGRLAATVRKRPTMFSRDTHNTASVTIDIGSTALTPYLGFVLDGTPPHEIRPRGAHYVQAAEGPAFNGKGHRLKRRRVQNSALRFMVNGEIRFATVVHHPGTAPDDFVTRGLIEGFAQ
jgi:hypothetical protein